MRTQMQLDKIDAIIEQVMAASRAKRGSVLSGGRTYSDEPLLARGSQLKNYIPEPLRRARELAKSPRSATWSDARLFVEQARLLEDFEDDYPYDGSYRGFLPSYQDMSIQQLRAYFTWRAHARRGSFEKPVGAFAQLYAYELINGVGVGAGAGGFEALRGLYEGYRGLDPMVGRYLEGWLVDYVVYYGLDPDLARPYAALEHDDAVGVLEAAEKAALASAPPRGSRRRATDFGAHAEEDEGLFGALAKLAAYDVRASELHRQAPEDLERLCCAVVRRLMVRHDRNHELGYAASLFGELAELPYYMFSRAVFWPQETHASCEVRLGPRRVYRCRGKIWTLESLHDGGHPSEALGDVLYAVDMHLREALGFEPKLEGRGEPKYLAQIIDREVADYLAWKEAHAPRRIEIDLSKLAGIRSTAAVTCESLLVDEEREEAGGTHPSGPMSPLAELDDSRPGSPMSFRAEPGGPCPSGTVSFRAEPGGPCPAESRNPDPTATDCSQEGQDFSTTGAKDAPSARNDMVDGAQPPQEPSAQDCLGSPNHPQVLSAQGEMVDGAQPPQEPSARKDAEAPSHNSTAAPSPYGLSPTELGLLRALLAGESPASPADLLVDSVNEKLFDLVGDTVLEFGEDGMPRVIEEYAEDLKAIV